MGSHLTNVNFLGNAAPDNEQPQNQEHQNMLVETNEGVQEEPRAQSPLEGTLPIAVASAPIDSSRDTSQVPGDTPIQVSNQDARASPESQTPSPVPGFKNMNLGDESLQNSVSILPVPIQPQNIKKKRQRRQPVERPAAPPPRTRQSARMETGNAEAVEEEKEEDLPPPQPRGVIPPTGTTRIPFHFNVDPAKKNAAENKLQQQLNITMNSSGSKRVGINAGSKRNNEAQGSEMPSKPAHIDVKIGDDYQAVVDDYSEVDREERDDLDEREECFWTPPDMATMIACVSADADMTDDNVENRFYGEFEMIVWRPVWRQHESQIPKEYVLQIFIECDYKAEEALNEVERCLGRLSQRIKPLCVGQAILLHSMMRNKKNTRRIFQEFALKNYHIGEVHLLLVIFRRLYKRQKKVGIPCNCDDMMCQSIPYEPQYACKNCSQHIRDTTEYDNSRLCLMCITFTIAYEKPRQVKTCWNDEELLYMAKWTEFETRLKRKLSRSEFLEMYQKENNQRWLNGDLTQEERDMLDYKQLSVPNRQSVHSLTPEEQDYKNRKTCALLQPFLLPHVTLCNCGASGNITRLSKYFGVTRFNETKKKEFREALVNSNGNIEAAAKQLEVEEELVERFLKFCKKNYDVWEDMPINNLHIFQKRPRLATKGLPIRIDKINALLKAMKVERATNNVVNGEKTEGSNDGDQQTVDVNMEMEE